MTVQPNGPPGTWILAFADEFDDSPGMSGPIHGLQPSKWNCGWFSGPISPGNGNTMAVTDPINSGTIAYFGPASIKFPGDSAVHLRLQNGVDNGGTFNTRTVESGAITTAGLMNLNPASIPVATSPTDLRPYTINGPCVLEFSARIPGPDASATHYWPVALLTNAGQYFSSAHPTGADWPGGQNYLSEIDLIEWSGGGSLGSSGAFDLHAGSTYAGGAGSGIPASLQATDLSLAYHTYTYLFTATTITIWVDGILVTNATPTAAQMAAQTAYPLYLLFNFQANTGASLPTTANSTPSDMMIDYVRVWNGQVLPPIANSFPYYGYKVEKDGTQRKRRVKVIGGHFDNAAITDTFSGNGSNKVFSPLSQQPKTITSVTVAGTQYKTGTTGRDTFNSGGFAALVDKVNKILTFFAAPANGSNNVAITYTYEAMVVTQVLDQDASNTPLAPAYAIPTYDSKVNDTNLISTTTASTRGLAEVSKFGAPKTIIRCKSQKYAPIGFIIYFTATLDNIINQPYVVQSVIGRHKGGPLAPGQTVPLNEFEYQLGYYQPTLLDHIHNANKALNRSPTTANINLILQYDLSVQEPIVYSETITTTPGTSKPSGVYGTAHYGSNSYS